jgi:hypothetical protein
MVCRHAPGINTGSKDLTSLVQAYNRAFTPEVNSLLNENLGGILSGTQCQMGDSSILSGLTSNVHGKVGVSSK